MPIREPDLHTLDDKNVALAYYYRHPPNDDESRERERQKDRIVGIPLSNDTSHHAGLAPGGPASLDGGIPTLRSPWRWPATLFAALWMHTQQLPAIPTGEREREGWRAEGGSRGTENRE